MNMIHENLSGEEVDLYIIISGVEGQCGEDCSLCARSCNHETGCAVHGLLDEGLLAEAARSNEAEGADRFSIVNSGRRPSDRKFERLVSAYARMHSELNIGLCASVGFLTRDQLRRLRKAGVTRIHCNLETSRRFSPKICTTHTYDDKVAMIKRAKSGDLEVCWEE